MSRTAFCIALGLISLVAPSALRANEGDVPAITPYAELRYRLEVVDQDGLPEDAVASTLRVRTGIKTAKWHGLSALVEGEAIIRIGPEDLNDTVNRRSSFPVVADPSDVLLNQALIAWQPNDSIGVTGGRQVINLDNQRWVGSVGWRQNDQTFDGVRATLKPRKDVAVDYLYVWRVNRVFGPDSPQGIWRGTNIHGARMSWRIAEVGTVSAYGYFLDIPSAPASSSHTLGMRLQGDRAIGSDARLLYAAEYARQSDQIGGPADFTSDYQLAEFGISARGSTFRGGWERLEGNGTIALQTPLATLHAFNGWADKFLVTPPGGLRDFYLDAGYKFSENSPLRGVGLRGLWHDFNATSGRISYGREVNLQASYPLNNHTAVLMKFAHYDADGFATDTTKAWFSIEAKF